MLTREDIFKHVKENYDTVPDYPFEKFLAYAALRYESNEKWYGLVMNVSLVKLGLEGEDEAGILNLKCLPEINESIRNGRDILPGYHMDKEHWVSLILERMNSEGEIYNLIEQSFYLTK